MTLTTVKGPALTLQLPGVPSVTLSAPVVRLDAGHPAPARMVRERGRKPSCAVIEGTLMVFINGLLSDEDDPIDALDVVTLVYFTPSLS